jgi:hypothetical protein
MIKLLSERGCLPDDETAGAVCDMAGATVEPEPASGHLMAALRRFDLLARPG